MPEWNAPEHAEDRDRYRDYVTTAAAANAIKDKRMSEGMAARANSYLQNKYYNLGLPDGTQVTANGRGDILLVKTPDGRIVPAAGAGPSVQTWRIGAVFNDIHAKLFNMNTEIAKLPDKPFPPAVRAKLIQILSSEEPDGSSFWNFTKTQEFVTSYAKGDLTDDQVAYVTALESLRENAMALRAIQGTGGSSDMLRHQILAMLPGPDTPSKKYAQAQMKQMENTVTALEKDRPKLGFTPAAAPMTADDLRKALKDFKPE
jgi:hypothetical protein